MCPVFILVLAPVFFIFVSGRGGKERREGEEGVWVVTLSLIHLSVVTIIANYLLFNVTGQISTLCNPDWSSCQHTLLFETRIWPKNCQHIYLCFLPLDSMNIQAMCSATVDGWQQWDSGWTVAFHQKDNSQCQVCWLNYVKMSSMW